MLLIVTVVIRTFKNSYVLNTNHLYEYTAVAHKHIKQCAWKYCTAQSDLKYGIYCTGITEDSGIYGTIRTYWYVVDLITDIQ